MRFIRRLLSMRSTRISARSSAATVISAISRAISAPSEIAMPTSAAESAGESFCFFLLYEICLILRQYLGIVLIYADLLCDRFCRTLTVSGHHNNLFQAGFFQLADNLGRFRTKRIFDTDNCSKYALNCKIQMRILCRQAAELLFHTFRNDTATIYSTFECISS